MLRPAVQVASPLRRTLAHAAWIILVVWAGTVVVGLGGSADDPPVPACETAR